MTAKANRISHNGGRATRSSRLRVRIGGTEFTRGSLTFLAPAIETEASRPRQRAEEPQTIRRRTADAGQGLTRRAGAWPPRSRITARQAQTNGIRCRLDAPKISWRSAAPAIPAGSRRDSSRDLPNPARVAASGPVQPATCISGLAGSAATPRGERRSAKSRLDGGGIRAFSEFLETNHRGSHRSGRIREFCGRRAARTWRAFSHRTYGSLGADAVCACAPRQAAAFFGA